MFTVQIGDVAYNPVEQCFDALVTFHLDQRCIQIASSYYAPINSDIELISKGLTRVAMNWLKSDTPEKETWALPRIHAPQQAALIAPTDQKAA